MSTEIKEVQTEKQVAEGATSQSTPQPTNTPIKLPLTVATPGAKPATPTIAAPATVATVAGGPKAVSLTTAVNQAQGRSLPIPKGLTKFNTKELSTAYFHGCVYSETDGRKSSTAASFGSPEDVRIILTRRKEQLIPLREAGYEVALVEDAESLLFALQFPERLWPEWAERPNRTLVLDDATEGVAMLLDDAEVIDGKEVKDKRRSYSEAGNQLRDAIQVVLKKPMHFVIVALAKVRENQITNEERIGPDLPPSMQNMLLTELEFVFYINKQIWKFYTTTQYITVTDTDQNGKEKTFKREIFAKQKLPMTLIGKGVLRPIEDMDLQAIWQRIKSGKPAGQK